MHQALQHASHRGRSFHFLAPAGKSARNLVIDQKAEAAAELLELGGMFGRRLHPGCPPTREIRMDQASEAAECGFACREQLLRVDAPRVPAACLPLLRENAVGVDGVVVEALDWTEPVASSLRADVVLAADCLLPGREGLFAPLATTLAALLAGDAVAYFVYEQRCMDCGPFFELLRGTGVAVSCIPDDDLHPEYRAPEIRVLELRRT